MKKISRLITMAFAVFVLVSCEDVPSPFGTVTPPSPEPESSDIEPKGSGTAADPFNVQKAINYVKELGADVESSTEVYVKGKVLSISEISASYGNASFVLSDNTEGSNKFTAYRVKGFNNQKITDENMIKVGDEVVVCGKIVNYRGNTPETVQNSAYIYSVNGEKGGGTPGETTAEAKGSGTQADPYNVAGVLKFINTLGADTESSNEVYIKGKIKEVNEQFGTQYGNATFTMIDEGYTAIFTAYRILYFNNQKYTSGDGVKEGDEAIVCGKVVNYRGNTPETVQGNSYLYSLNGKTGDNGNTEPTSGEAKGSGTLSDPYNVVAISEICAKLGDKETSSDDYYIKGKICSIKYEFSAQYGTATFNISDNGQAGETEFTAYSVYYLGNTSWVDGNTQIKVGDEVILNGKITNYGGTLETASKKAYIYSLNGKTADEGGSTSGGESGSSETPSTLTNGDFETWVDGVPTGWKSASTASSATLAQSTDAHGGKYSVNVNGNESSNKRLASQEIKLSAGSYTFSFYAKATTTDNSQVRPGYVPITDGKAGSYVYGDYATLSTSWSQVSYDFTLTEDATICIVVMNPKKSNYSSGKDVLIDDATLTKK